MRLLVSAAIAALALTGAAHADDVHVATLSPVADVSLPFSCNWGYDWDERCYREDGSRLPVGGEQDKVWRSALRFSTASIPSGAAVVTAELSLWYDRICVAPRKTSRPCDGRGFELVAHPILTARWFSEREVEFGPQVGATALEPFAPPQWTTWDLTDLVAEWTSGALPNYGVLLKLADGQEDYGSSGPLFPSARYANAALRPRLTIWYVLDQA
jgi:hypothetical protein